MYSWKESVNAKIPAVRIPGRTTGMTTCRSICSRVAPSRRALSSISLGTLRKKPIRSQVQNGTVKVGYARISDQIVLSTFNAPTNCENGMKRIVGGIR